MSALPINEQFPALAALPFCRHGFVHRVPGIEAAGDKADALRRLDSVHSDVRDAMAIATLPLLTAEQVHGSDLAVVDAPVADHRQFEGCDGIVTNQPNVVLGIHVADCGAVFIVDPVQRVIALVHSGKKGTEFGIAPKAIATMSARFGSKARDLVVQLSPCIRPPHYEVDFAARIIAECRDAGVESVHDSGICTACDLERYYSYRAEKGRTGRMLALLAIVQQGLN